MFTQRNQYMRDLSSVGSSQSIRLAFPILTRISQYIPFPIPIIRRGTDVLGRIRTRAGEMLQHHYRVVEEEGEDSKPTLLSKLYRPKLGEEGLEFQEIRANAQSYIVAGSDTTSNTLTYLIWLVCKHNDVRVQLMEELDTLADSYEDSDLKKLPYLNHIIDETLRMYSSVPAGLPREVTAHCSYFPSFFRANVLLTNVCQVPPEGIEFCGHWIPGGTTVSAQAYSMHRDEVVFPNPLRFDPSRWERPTQAMKDSFVPFGGGSRSK